MSEDSEAFVIAAENVIANVYGITREQIDAISEKIGRGEARKRDARYKSDKVYSKGEAASTIASLNVLQNLPPKVRKQFTEELWYALNSELSDDKRKFRASLIAKRIMNSLYENAYSPDDMARIRKLESEIRALRRRIEIAKLQETRDKLYEEIKNSFMSYVIKRKIA